MHRPNTGGVYADANNIQPYVSEERKKAQENEVKVARLRTTLKHLESKQAQAEQKTRAEREKARILGLEGNKGAAIRVLKRATKTANEASHYDGLIQNVSGQLKAIESISINKSVVSAMRDGAQVMSDMYGQMDSSQLEQDMMDIKLQAREANMSSRLLSKQMFDNSSSASLYGPEYDDDENVEYEEELEKIMNSASLSEQPSEHNAIAEEEHEEKKNVLSGVRSQHDMRVMEADIGI